MFLVQKLWPKHNRLIKYLIRGLNLKSKTFLFFLMQTRRLVASFEALNSYLAQLPDGLWSCTVA